MEFLYPWADILLWGSVSMALVFEFVSRWRAKESVNDRRKHDPNFIASKILSRLQDMFLRNGRNEPVDVYELGKDLGFSHEQVRAALSEFKKDEQIDVVLVTETHVKLGIRGQMMRRP